MQWWQYTIYPVKSVNITADLSDKSYRMVRSIGSDVSGSSLP
jgi:hypothetical protein